MITVTEVAQEKLREVLDSNGTPDSSVRVAVVRGPHGCVHGWRLAIEGTADPADTVVDAGDVHILVESELLETLDGASIDYREDATGIGFTIEAPNTPPPMHQQNGGCHH